MSGLDNQIINSMVEAVRKSTEDSIKEKEEQMSRPKSELQKQLESLNELSEEEQERTLMKLFDESEQYGHEDRMCVYNALALYERKKKGLPVEQEEEALVLDSPMKGICIVIGTIGTLVCIGASVWATIDKGPIWVIVEFILATVLGIYCFGMGQFYKVTITPEKLEHRSSFFGIKRTFDLKKITKVVIAEDGKKIRVYKGKRKILTMEDQLACGKDLSIPYFEGAGIPIQDERPKINEFKVHERNLMFGLGVFMTLPMVLIIVPLLMAQIQKIMEGRSEEVIRDLGAFIVIFAFLGYTIYLILYRFMYKVMIKDDDISVYPMFAHKQEYRFSEITGYKLFRMGSLRGSVDMYHGEEILFTLPTHNENMDLFVAKLNAMGIPCLKHAGKEGDESERFEGALKLMEVEIENKDSYLYRE